MQRTSFQLYAQPHRETLIRFGLLLLILAGYFGYLSWKFDFATGGLVAALTWSFFVLCTPVADAGFLLDFPIRLVTGIPMRATEVLVWVIAFSVNGSILLWAPQAYETTFLTRLLHQVLTTPWPYWGIIGLSAMGTFLSVYFGDEMLDVLHHRDRVKAQKHGFKYQLLLVIALGALAVGAYTYLMSSLGIHLPG